MGHETLPLPVASLARRARNAKSPKERHDTAFYAWEASVRLAVAARPPAERAGLAMASLGHWVGALSLSLEEQILDAAPLLAAFSLFSEVGLDKRASPRAVTPRKLLDALPAYRNHVMGHGAARSPEFYDASAQILLGALEAAWSAGVFFRPGEALVFVDTVELSASGEPSARVVELTGLASFVRATPMAVDPGCRPHRLYLSSPGGGLRSLHPWLLYVEAELREQVFFFNGRARSSQFLDYLSGESLRGKGLSEQFPEVERELDALFSNVPRPGGAEEGPSNDPAVFGDYRLLGELGQGGMGIVYLARQESLDRLVALKVLPPQLNEDPIAVARFDREIRALTRCDHPNVVKILASGKAKGRPYYVMELVQGADLSQISKELSTHPDFPSAFSSAAEGARKAREKLYEGIPVLPAPAPPSLPAGAHARDRALAVLFRDAARGIQHLHEQGILHRDIKPSNLMVTGVDHRVVVMDLGLAMVKDATRALTREHTAILGTLRYMPPEQLQRSLLQLDARADVYALGATLYELLADRPMFDGDSEPQLIEQILRSTPANVSKVRPAVSRDLGLIVQKAVDKDPALRYQSAEALARDLDNFIHGRTVEARPPSLAYLAQVTVRRNRGLSAAVLGALLFALIGGIVFVQGLRIANRREHAQRLSAEASAAAARRSLAELHEEKGREALLSGDKGRAAVLLSTAFAAGIEGAGLRRMLPLALAPLDGERARLRGHVGEVGQAVFNPEGTLAATGSADGTVKLWEARSGRLLASFDSATDAVTWLAFSPDGEQLAAGSADTRVRLIDTVTGSERVLVGHASAVSAGGFGPGGTRLVTATDRGELIVWDVASAKPARTVEAHEGRIWAVEFSQDRTRFVTASSDGTARLWTLEGSAPPVVLRGHGRGVLSVQFGPSGGELLTASLDGTAIVWDLERAAPRARIDADQRELAGARWSPDGARVVTVGSDGSLRLWDPKGSPICRGRAHRDRATDVVFTPDGRRLATASEDGTVALWSSSDCGLLEVLGSGDSPVRALAMSADGAALLAGSADGQARVWNPQVGAAGSVLLAAGQVLSARFSPDGGEVVTTDSAGQARLWDETGRVSGSFEHGQAKGTWVTDARFSPDESRVLTVSGGVVQLWDRRTHRLLRTQESPGHPLTRARFDGHGARVVALSSSDRQWGVWDVATGRPVFEQGPENGVVSAEWLGSEGPLLLRSQGSAFTADPRTGETLVELDHLRPTLAVATADGRRILTADCDGQLRVSETDSARVLTRLSDRPGCPRGAAFGHAGRWLAVADSSRRVVIWDWESGARQAVLEGHATGVVAMAFSPDDETIATAGEDGQLRLWETGRGRLLAVLEGHHDHVTALEFDPAGTRLLSASWDGTARLWRVPAETRSPQQLAALVAERAPWMLDGEQLVARAPVVATAAPRESRERSARASAALLRREVPDALTAWDAAAPADTTEAFAQRFAGSRLDGYVSRCRYSPGSLDAMRVSADGRTVVFTDRLGSGWLEPSSSCERKALPDLEAGETIRCASESSRVAASSDAEGKLTVWELATGRRLQTLRGHSARVTHCAFSADDQVLASAGEDGTARVWEVAKGTARATVLHDGPVLRSRLSGDGRILCTLSGKEVKVWDGVTGELRHSFSGTVDWETLLTSAPARRAVAASARQVCALDLETGKELWCKPSPDGRAPVVAISSDGAWVVAEQTPGSIAVLDAGTGAVHAALRTPGGQVSALTLDPLGRYVAASTEHGVLRLWELGGTLLEEWPLWTTEWEWLAIPPHTTRVIAASADGTVSVLQARSSRAVEVPLVREGFLALLATSADGSGVLSVGDDGSVRVHQARTGREIAELVPPRPKPPAGPTVAKAEEAKPPVVTAVALDAKATRALIARTEGPAQLWDITARKVLRELATPEDIIRAAAFSADGTRVVLAGDRGVVRLFDSATGREVRALSGGHVARITAVALDAAGTQVASGSADRSVKLWKVGGQKPVALLYGHRGQLASVSFDASGSRLLTSSEDGSARLWDTATGALLTELGGHQDQVNAARFLSGGRWVATATRDGLLQLWEASTGRALFNLAWPDDEVVEVAEEGEGRLALATRSGMLRWLALPPADRPLTEAEWVKLRALVRAPVETSVSGHTGSR